MVSRFSPPVLYLTDDDDDNEPEPNMPYISSYASVVNDSLPRKKRRVPDGNVQINPTVANWSKRQRNGHYQQPHQSVYNHIHHTPETIAFNSDSYDFPDPQSHSFHAFDWTSEPRAPPRTFSNHIQTTSRMAVVQAPNVMNVVKHHLDQSDTIPIIPLPHSNDRYEQRPLRKSTNIPTSSTPPSPIPLPLPTPTSSLVRPQAQRIHSGKNIRIPYPHSTPLQPPPPPPPSAPVHHPIKPVFSPLATYRPPSHATISTPVSTTEIRRQPLNGTGVLSAFHDSKCYRCNMCKFITITSSKLLQHLFTHIFFCHQCSFYSYSQHNLYQHVFEKHHSIPHTDITDPKSLELLYVTRCSDGTFALCMDSSTPQHQPQPPPPPPPPPTTVNKPPEKHRDSPDNITKPKPQKKKPRPKKVQDNEIIVVSEKRDPNPQPPPPPPPPSSSSVIPKRPAIKDKPGHTYVVMKHRRCYSIRHSPCLHPLTLEYNICREHTIRHMCRSQGILNRQKFKSKSPKWSLIDEVALCVKTVVNRTVEYEENRNSMDIVYELPNTILDLIIPNADLRTITSLLKLTNKYDKSIEHTEQNQLESSIRTSNQHIFVLSSIGTNKNEQAVLSSLHTSITNSDSTFMQTKLNELPISCNNTNRFLKGNLNVQSSTKKPSTPNDLSPRPIKPKNHEPLTTNLPKPPVPRYMNNPPSGNNNSVTSSKARLSPTPSVIVID